MTIMLWNKGFYSRCRFMKEQELYASIAVYSQNIPTLVLGDQVKV